MFSIFGNVDQTPELKNVIPALSLFFHLFDVFGQFILIWKDSFFKTPNHNNKKLLFCKLIKFKLLLTLKT